MKRKFTLIELIIVIVVIGILAAMALPKFTGIVRNARISSMINDKETLEKTMLLHYQKHDKLPLLNEEQELIALDSNISLIKLVQAEEGVREDMKTIYTSLQETLKHYNDNEENLYRIDINEINNSLSKKLKYGHKKEDKDFYVYSTKTNNVYYYNTMQNGDGEIQHNEFNTKLKTSELVNKKFSYNLSEDGSIINNKPIIELTTDLNSLTVNSIIKWEYTFVDEDTKPTKISFILNDIEYDSFNIIPTQLDDGEYTIKLKMQDSKGLWSNEIVKSFNVVDNVLEDNIVVYLGNYSSLKELGYFAKNGEFVVTNQKLMDLNENYQIINFKYNSKFDYSKLENMSIEISTTKDTIYTDHLKDKGWISPKENPYKFSLKNINNKFVQNYYGKDYFRVIEVKTKENDIYIKWNFKSLRILKN